jgi:hypothetical protein
MGGFVRAGHSRPKDGLRSPMPGDPSRYVVRRKTWMPGTGPGMTVERIVLVVLMELAAWH